MKTCKYKTGFTLVEMLVVIAIVAVLAAMVISVAARIETREKEKHCRSTLVLLSTALAQFHDYDFNYKDSNYSAFGFPLDCNDFDEDGIAVTLRFALGADDVRISGVQDATAFPDPNDSSNEVMYLLLSMVPASRATLEKIDKKLTTHLDSYGTGMQITISSGEDIKGYPLLRVIDPWGTTLRYDYYDESVSPPDPDEARTFPLITSAGPDRDFDTVGDNITNR